MENVLVFECDIHILYEIRRLNHNFKLRNRGTVLLNFTRFSAEHALLLYLCVLMHVCKHALLYSVTCAQAHIRTNASLHTSEFPWTRLLSYSVSVEGIHARSTLDICDISTFGFSKR